jgi:preprotein translocase subunit SecA
VQYQHADAGDALHPQAAFANAEPEREPMPAVQPYRREGRKIGRNEPCWCGSDKKFKQCHGKLT